MFLFWAHCVLICRNSTYLSQSRQLANWDNFLQDLLLADKRVNQILQIWTCLRQIFETLAGGHFVGHV